MPEHVHLLIGEPVKGVVSGVIHALKLSVAMRRGSQLPECLRYREKAG
jgi:REP element-mobilizing transposase RayT